MRCFEHQEADAIGLCKACHKGLCSQCAVDLGHSLTCAGACEVEARQLHAQVLQNRNSLKTGRSSLYLWPSLLLFMGGSMLVNELIRRGIVLNWGTLFGSGISLFALYMFFINRKWGRDMDASEDENQV